MAKEEQEEEKEKEKQEAEEEPILLLEYAAPVFRIHRRTVCLRTAGYVHPSSVTLLPTADVLDEAEPG